MYSLVAADLGQSPDVNAYGKPADMSMVATSDRLRHWTENLTQIWNVSVVANKDTLFYDARTELVRYNGTSESSLTLTNSTIATIFTCQVPELKSRFNIFISIVVADLVLLRVAWTLYNYVVCHFLKIRHLDANLCLGCLERGPADGAGTGEVETVDACEETEYQGRDVELVDLGRDHDEPADQQTLQKLLTREPIGS